MRRVPDPPQVTIQKLTEAFNKQDLDAITDMVAANCVVAALRGGTELVGAPALRARYQAHFEDHPKARMSVMGRMALGDTVVQHETISQGMTVAERRIAIYTVAHEKVTRVDLIR